MSKEDIIQMERALVDAIRTSNLIFLQTTIHDSLRCVAPNGVTVTKAMDMAAHEARAMRVDELTLSIEDVIIIGDNAVSVVIYDTKGVMMGQPIQGRFKYLRVWKKFEDGLKVISASCTQMME